MFLPTTKQELNRLGWDRPDVIIVSGDSYIDSPYIGAAVIGRVLMNAGFRVGIIGQPDVNTDIDIKRLGEPRLFWVITAGSVDSMVANYTASKKRRKADDYTPGVINNRRPDRAVIVYANLIKRFFKGGIPIVLGGIEASLRRICHYDYWSNRIRRSILFDAKADILIYGMGEKAVVNLAEHLNEGRDYRDIRGLSYISKEKKHGYVELPSYDAVLKSRGKFIESFHLFYRNNDPATAKGLIQQQDSRYMIQNPPSPLMSEQELDEIFALGFQREQHPYYRKQGNVRALDTIKFSILTHRGCYGECNFCSIAVHEGRTVQGRSRKSIIKEVANVSALSDFKGYILDVGGPTANMYGFECKKKMRHGSCEDRRCLYPEVCPKLRPDHSRLIDLLNGIGKTRGIKKVFVASGIRYDLLFKDKDYGGKYLKNIVSNHVSGQMKVAPEHIREKILALMGKSGTDDLLAFKAKFDMISRDLSKKQFLTYYMIAAHPGCSMDDMKQLKRFFRERLKMNPEQVQIFTPTPSTYSTLMYYTGLDPFTGEKIFVEKNIPAKEKQKAVVTQKRKKPL